MLNAVVTPEWLAQHDACVGGLDWFKGCGECLAKNVVRRLRAEAKSNWAEWLLIELLSPADQMKLAFFAIQQVLPVFEFYCRRDERYLTVFEAARRGSDQSELLWLTFERNRPSVADDRSRSFRWAIRAVDSVAQSGGKHVGLVIAAVTLSVEHFDASGEAIRRAILDYAESLAFCNEEGW
jgi:hypothetical protein